MADKEKGKVWYKIMIDFDEEIKKFQPSLEVDDAEEAIYNNDVPDITDLIAKIMEDISKRSSSRIVIAFTPFWRGREYCSSNVFLITPFLVQNKT